MAKVILILLTIMMTVGIYLISRRIYTHTKTALLNPVTLSTAAIIPLLLLFGLSYEDYKPSKAIMSYLLGPATVALALPLYRNRRVLAKSWKPILMGIFSGSMLTLVAVLLLSRLSGLDNSILLAIAPKSVTTPIAVEIARIIGGDPSLTATFVIATGNLGAIFGPSFLTLLAIRDPVARGLAMGVTSHGQGTSVILHEGETQGAMSGVAMAMTAVFTSAVAPWLIPWLITVGQ